ncbi:hypothetical protein JCM17960_03120 [Magnetospira thiophila]
MKRRLRIGIRGRFFSAIGFVAAATIVATGVAWISFTHLGETLDSVVGRSIPAMTYAAQLAERGGSIIGVAPGLVSARTEQNRQSIWQHLESQIEDMNRLLTELAGSETSNRTFDAFGGAIEDLHLNLTFLNALVSQRLERSIRKEDVIERLRWASADFLDEIEPMTDDIRFNISLALHRDGSPSFLEEELVRQRALFKINADGNLLAELTVRAANIPDEEALQATEQYYHEIEGRIKTNLDLFKSQPGALSLRQSITDIETLAKGPNGVFKLRAQELSDLDSEQQFLASNQSLLHRLEVLITEQVAAEKHNALEAASRSQEAIRQGRFWLIVAVVVSLIVAVPFVWLYVGRGLVGRIRRLDESMRSIAEGHLATDVPVEGGDEIGDMAVSLRTFRDTLSETQAELVQAAKLAALGQLTAGISHEINQPLSAIRHYARNSGLLLDKGRIDEAKENLSKISALVEKANRIVHNLRSLARKPQRDLRSIDMVSVLEDVLTLLDRRLREEGITVEIQIDDDCRNILAGQVRLEQVILNLFNNAIDAMRESPVRHLIVSGRRTKEWIEFQVGDTGSGITPNDMERIFDPFFTTKEVGQGLGLGLSISYNIIKDFGGSLWAESQLGDGTTFWLRLRPPS